MAHKEGEWIDIYGAPEYWIDAVAREMISPGVIKMTFGTMDRGQYVMRVKVLCAVETLNRERAITDAYLSAYGAPLVPN